MICLRAVHNPLTNKQVDPHTLNILFMPARSRLYSMLSLCLALLVMGSCGNNANDKQPDVKDVKVSVQTLRFDKDMYAIDTNHIADGLLKVRQKYPDFLDFFLDTVMNFGIKGNYNDTVTGIRVAVREYIGYKDYANLQDTINKYYPDTKETDEALASGFKYLRHYLPSFPLPKKVIYANHILLKIPPVFCVDTNITCVCLDMFLGPHFPYYKSVGVPDYLAPHLQKNYIPVAVFRTLFETMHPSSFDQPEQPLLDLMIQQGIEQYFLHKTMPNVPDSVLFGFTGKQIKWCEANENNLYNYFIQNNLLYNKHDAEIRTYVMDGPFAHNLGDPTQPGTTPGNVGTWMGYRIVAAYMSNNQSVTLKDLLDHKPDAPKILQDAHYRPK